MNAVFPRCEYIPEYLAGYQREFRLEFHEEMPYLF